jgi:hypothetical protein
MASIASFCNQFLTLGAACLEQRQNAELGGKQLSPLEKDLKHTESSHCPAATPSPTSSLIIKPHPLALELSGKEASKLIFRNPTLGLDQFGCVGGGGCIFLLKKSKNSIQFL